MTDRILHEIEPPPDAREHGGHEVLRCFVVDGGLSICMRRSFEEPAVFGRLFADLARHAAHVFAQDVGVDAGAALNEIRVAFDDALNSADDFDAPLMN